jgi:hypothetical protein
MFKWEEVISSEGGYSVKPQLVDAGVPFELITPFPAFFVCCIFPFRTHTFLEKRII